MVLYQVNSPIQQNADYVENKYENKVEDVLTEDSTADFEDKLYTIANWLLSSRLDANKVVVDRYADGNWAEKLFGIGYTVQIDGKEHIKAVEMDFIAIFLRHGIVGFAIFMTPLVYAVGLCIIKLFKRIKDFWNQEPALVYLYAVLIGLACAFLAGHVLVAPAVSIYIAACLVKCYACLTEEGTPALEEGA